MRIYYDKQTDYCEVFFGLSESNYAVDLNDFVSEFLSEKTGEVVGYSFENATVTLKAFPNLSEQLKLEFDEILNLKGGKND